jgi:hypothetical protein
MQYQLLDPFLHNHTLYLAMQHLYCTYASIIELYIAL